MYCASAREVTTTGVRLIRFAFRSFLRSKQSLDLHAHIVIIMRTQEYLSPPGQTSKLNKNFHRIVNHDLYFFYSFLTTRERDDDGRANFSAPRDRRNIIYENTIYILQYIIQCLERMMFIFRERHANAHSFLSNTT